MDRPDVPNPSIRPTSRVLRQGDIVMFELSKGMAGYAGQLHGMVSLGAPLERFVEGHAVALDAYDAIRRVLCTGCTGAQVADAASSIRQRGFNIGNPLTHGFGLGIESGLHVGLPGHPAYWPPTGVVFPEGASLTIEPNPCNADMSFGATAGAMVIVEGQSCTEIHARVSREIIRV
jgi:Xaa-Pro aminopeptidase